MCFRSQKVQLEKINFLQALNEKICSLSPSPQLIQLQQNLKQTLSEATPQDHSTRGMCFNHYVIILDIKLRP